MESIQLIDNHRTGMIHSVKEVIPAMGTLTHCDVLLPHSPDTADVDDDSELECENCKRLV